MKVQNPESNKIAIGVTPADASSNARHQITLKKCLRQIKQAKAQGKGTIHIKLFKEILGLNGAEPVPDGQLDVFTKQVNG